MTDFPASQTPLFLTPYSRYGTTGTIARMGGTILPAAITWVANAAIYIPISVPWPYPVNRVFWVNGSTIGNNVDFGIYSSSGSKIYSTGSTAQSGTSTLQYVTPTTIFQLPVGRYFFAYTCSGTTSTAFGSIVSTTPFGALAGLLQQATALPLPATATFATLTSLGPVMCGVTRTAAGSVF